MNKLGVESNNLHKEMKSLSSMNVRNGNGIMEGKVALVALAVSDVYKDHSKSQVCLK